MASRRTATLAEISLVQLRNCLVNLPPSLVSLLVNANTPAQNCVVELQYRAPNLPPSSPSRSFYLGWTGLDSKSRPSLTSTRQSSREPSFTSSTGPTDTSTVEIDSSFARTLHIPDGAKVGVILHIDPVIAHTVHIEPLTPADWDIIELHATFLETNLLAQIRALPNPQYAPSSSQKQEKNEGKQQASHPLTIHLSPTSTASVLVTQLTPSVPRDVPFAKIGTDSEVIVAPKTRNQGSTKGDSRSVLSGSARSGRTSGTHRQKAQRAEAKTPLFVRGVDQQIYPHIATWEGGEEETDSKSALQIWVDNDYLADNKNFRGVKWVAISVISPSGLQPALDAQGMQKIKDLEISEAGSGATRVVARLERWHASPSRSCAILSSQLCTVLSVSMLCGKIVRLEPAPKPINEARSVKIYPFIASHLKQTEGLRFGGETRASREAATKKFRSLMGRNGEFNVLNGPITDGMILPSSLSKTTDGWEGGILRLSGQTPASDGEKTTISWAHAKEDNLSIDIQQEIARPEDPRRVQDSKQDTVPLMSECLVGVDRDMAMLKSHAQHGSSILLCGGQGSGKTSVSKSLATLLRREELYNVTYFPCGKLVTEETRVSAVKDSLQRLFMQAVWGARLGGRAMIILDDLDKLCPAEQELQVGNDNARSRQISELLCSDARRYCTRESNVILVATARGKDSLHSVVVGSHLMPETVDLKAPDKTKRKEILAALVRKEKGTNAEVELNGVHPVGSGGSWMDEKTTSHTPPPPEPHHKRSTYQDIDLLDIAGQTDGYMPGDLLLLFARARSEAMNRAITNADSSLCLNLQQKDFENALDGFTPASLRSVALQSSSTTFSAIGGLRETRKTLLETLQYPTTYAPIFAQCPLRLRSGLLLYGYPGCGKTLLASAVAGECGLNFISVKGPEILNKYIGASEKSVRDLFERAQAARPCVLFFDEFDSIAPKRGHDSTGVTDRVVNQMLTQMDGAEGLSGVYVLAATSRPDLIDPALLRPGRLDKSLLCDMPDEEDRLDIIQALSGKLKIDASIIDGPPESKKSLYEVSRRTQGYSGADLQAVVYNAHLEAIHDALGDVSTVNGVKPSEATKASKAAPRRHSSMAGAPSHHELVQFRHGIAENKLASAALIGPKATSERAALLAKLEALWAAKRRERDLRRGASGSLKWQQMTEGADKKDDKEGAEVVIAWTHLEKSLATTRSSISARERVKLESIYNEFVQGRNGEMPSGQGPMEIGARSSLM